MGNPPQSIILVRHGETAWSLSGQHTGRTDIPLTDQGRAMAVKLAPRLSSHCFAAVFCSPLIRARETAELAGFKDAVELRPSLMEWDYGAYEGLTTEAIRSSAPEWTLWRDGVPDGETLAQVEARADAILEEASAVKGDVALFSHGHLLRVLAARWLGLPGGAGALFLLGTTAVSRLTWDSERRVLGLWNDQS